MKQNDAIEEALSNLRFCLKTIKNLRIKDNENCIWSSGSHDRPTIKASDLKTLVAAVEQAQEDRVAVRELSDLISFLKGDIEWRKNSLSLKYLNKVMRDNTRAIKRAGGE